MSGSSSDFNMELSQFDLSTFMTGQQLTNSDMLDAYAEVRTGHRNPHTGDGAGHEESEGVGSAGLVNLGDPGRNGNYAHPPGTDDNSILSATGAGSSGTRNFGSFTSNLQGQHHMSQNSYTNDQLEQQHSQHHPSHPHQSHRPGYPHHNQNALASTQSHMHSGISVAAETLKHQLAQQIKLQQLQQLQNQILQQQIELISSQGQTQREMLMHGLLTPTSSSELRPTIHHSYLSPMTLQAHNLSSSTDPGGILSGFASPASTPAENSAFPTAASGSLLQMTPNLHGSSDMFSPLTSPALGPLINSGSNGQFGHYDTFSMSSPMRTSPVHRDMPLPNDFRQGASQQQMQNSTTPLLRGSAKRTLPEDSSNPRKRQSPMIIASNPNPVIAPANASSQKRNRNSRSRPASMSAIGILGEAGPFSTPSPIDIDISMPPPAPPAPPLPPVGLIPAPIASMSSSLSSTSTRSSASATGSSSSTSPSPNIVPVTPAMIMNLGYLARLPTGLIPLGVGGKDASQDRPSGTAAASTSTTAPQKETEVRQTQQLRQQESSKAGVAGRTIAPETRSTKPIPKSKASAPKGKASVPTTPALLPRPEAGNKSTKPSNAMRASAHKSILPSGYSAEAAAELNRSLIANKSSPTQLGGGSTKSSHKAAEQKRRDSLKAGFDDLRLLLPPITIDADPDEPLLPGSAPPRGPQRNLPPGIEDHPNRGVSKLALLRCSNEFIVKLVKRIERRDLEIEKLRDEARFLRERLGIDTALGSQQDSVSSIGAEGGTEVPMGALGAYLEQSLERQWVDLERDLDEIEREDMETKGSRKTAKAGDSEDGQSDPVASRSRTPVAVERRLSAGSDAPDE